MATSDAKTEKLVAIMITRWKRDVILHYGYPFADIENQLRGAGEVDLIRIADAPYWWEQVAFNLYISEKENSADPDIANQLRSLIDRIAEHLE